MPRVREEAMLASSLDRPRTATTATLSLCVLVVTVLLLTLAPGTARAEEAPNAKPGSKQRSGSVRGTLASLPPIAQPGTSAAAPQNAGILVATFTPADPGRRVTLERQVRGGWKTVATGAEDAWGAATFSPSSGTYRARTTTGGRTWVTGTMTTSRWRPTFEDTFSGTTLDTSVWNDQKREHESVYAPRTCARVDPAARRVAGGVLHLGVAADPARLGLPCNYTSAGSS